MRKKGKRIIMHNFEVQTAAPFDGRQVVDLDEDLLLFTASNSYNGMPVYSEESKEFSYLIDKSNPAVATNWRKLLPKAGANVLGGIRVGSGLAIDANGVLSANVTNSYSLPEANTTTLGGVKVGNGLAIATGGVLSVVKASNSVLGGVRVGSGLAIDANGVLTASVAAGYSLPTAGSNTLGGIKVGSGLAIAAGVLAVDGGYSANAVSTVIEREIGGVIAQIQLAPFNDSMAAYFACLGPLGYNQFFATKAQTEMQTYVSAIQKSFVGTQTGIANMGINGSKYDECASALYMYADRLDIKSPTINLDCTNITIKAATATTGDHVVITAGTAVKRILINDFKILLGI